MDSKITVQDLENLCQMIIRKLKFDEVDSISFEYDLYWSIAANEAVDMKKTPEIIVGSLNDDVAELKRALSEGEIYSYLEFDRLASVLTFISEIQVPTKNDRNE